jgi:hypothetical protein
MPVAEIVMVGVPAGGVGDGAGVLTGGGVGAVGAADDPPPEQAVESTNAASKKVIRSTASPMPGAQAGLE